MPAESPIPGWLQEPTVLIHDPGEPNIIHTNTQWTLHVNWETRGPANVFMAGFFHLHAFLESIGPDINTPDLDLVVIDEPLRPSSAQVIPYLVHLDVPATLVTASHAGQIFKLVVSMTFRTLGGVPGPIAAYAEGPILQFFNPT